MTYLPEISTSIETKENGKILILRQGGQVSVPLFCSVCCLPMRSLEDSVTFREHGTCSHCEMWWGNFAKFGSWKEGWRPNPETEGWDEYYNSRILSLRHLIKIR